MADEKQAIKPTTKAKEDPANAYLPREVAEHYEVIGWQGSHKQNFGKFGIIDIKTMTLTRAGSLVSRGFKKLTRK